MPGLFPASEYPREPYTPERAIVMLVYFKCCDPRASDRELARVVSQATGERLHNETIKALLQRYFFWRHAEFRDLINYPVPADPQTRCLEMVKLRSQGWSEQTVAVLLRSTRVTVRKWVRRFQHEQEAGYHEQARLLEHSHAPHTRARPSTSPPGRANALRAAPCSAPRADSKRGPSSKGVRRRSSWRRPQ